MEIVSGSLISELLAIAPRPLIESRGELIFLDGQYLFHYREDQQDHYKLVSAAAVRQAFSHEPVETGWIPEGVVRWGIASGETWVVRFVPPGKHELCFASEDPLKLALPGFVFLGVGKQYFLWAIEAAFHPTASTCHAPLPNIHPNGSICFGSNILPAASCQTIDQAWRLFIQSPFNGDLASGKSRKHPDNVCKQLQSVAKRRLHQYPTKDLQRFGSSVAATVEAVLYRRRFYE